jgi:phage-related protein
MVRFLSDSRKVLRDFPKDARSEAEIQLQRIQKGLRAEDFKPMHDIEIARERFRQLTGGR